MATVAEATEVTATVVACRTEDLMARRHAEATVRIAMAAVEAVAIAVVAIAAATTAAEEVAVMEVAVEATKMVEVATALKAIQVVVAAATGEEVDLVDLPNATKKILCSSAALEKSSNKKSNRSFYKVICSQYAFVC